MSQPSQLLITNVGAVCVQGAMDEPPRLEEPLLPSHKPAVFTALRTLAVASALVVGTLCVSIAVPALGSPASLFTGAAPMRVLVTGFKPWGNYTSNPSQDVAMQLNGSCVAGVCIEGRSLSVDRAGVDVIAHRVVEANQHWDAVIHLGFESVSKGLRIETAAANIVSSEMCHGCWSTDVPCDKGGSGWRDIHPGSPCLLATTAPLDALALPLLRPPRAPGTSGSALELWSRDAGTYCALAPRRIPKTPPPARVSAAAKAAEQASSPRAPTPPRCGRLQRDLLPHAACGARQPGRAAQQPQAAARAAVAGALRAPAAAQHEQPRGERAVCAGDRRPHGGRAVGS